MLRKLLSFALGIETPAKSVVSSVSKAPVQAGSRTAWNLEDPVFSLHVSPPDDDSTHSKTALTLGELCTGTIVFGGTGSGKTSGTAEHLALALLRYGFGGLVLCAKPEEAQEWVKRAEAAGRSNDLVLFSTEHEPRFNPLQFEADQFRNAVHGFTENLLQILRELCETDGKQGDDPYWPQSRDKLFTNTLDLMQLAGEEISFSSLHSAIMAFVQDEAVSKMLEKALERVATMSESRQKDYLLIEGYFKNEWQILPEKTRETIKSLATNAVEPFARGAIRELFSTTSTITPEALGKGKIVVVDLPAITLSAGKVAAVVWKYMVQKWSERRSKEGDKTRPIFIFADECQYFATPRDAVFQSTARSSRVATAYLTQTIGSLNFFGNPQFRQHREMLLANLINKVFHQNQDHETNEWAANLIGKALIMRTSTNAGSSAQHSAPQGQPAGASGSSSYGKSKSEQYDFLFHPIRFQELLHGGNSNNLIVTGILVAGGRRQFWGRSFAEIAFRQGKLTTTEPPQNAIAI